MKTSTFLLGLLLVGCSTTTQEATQPPTGDPADVPPGDMPPAQCTADAAAVDVSLTTDGTLTRTPVAASTLDGSARAAIWYEGGGIEFARFGDDGKKLASATLVPSAKLPGGDAALSALSIATVADGQYAFAYEDMTSQSVRFRIVDGKGAGGTEKTLNPTTRKVGNDSGTVTARSPVVRRTQAGFAAKWVETLKIGSNSSRTYVVIQLFDASGKPTTQSAVDPNGYSETAGAADATLISDRLAFLGYKQGSGSIADLLAVLSQSSAAGNLATWNQATVALPQPVPTGDVTRGRPTLMADPANPKGSILVDLASYTATDRDSAHRIEVAWLDDLGAVKKSAPIDIPATEAILVADPIAKVEDGVVYVAWVSAKDGAGTDSPSVHVVAMDAAGKKVRADIPVKLKSGYFDDLTRMLEDLDARAAATTGAVRLAYAWTSSDSADNRARHSGTQTICLTTRR